MAWEIFPAVVRADDLGQTSVVSVSGTGIKLALCGKKQENFAVWV